VDDIVILCYDFRRSVNSRQARWIGLLVTVNEASVHVLSGVCGIQDPSFRCRRYAALLSDMYS
jgi:hypothetical protein